jgi:hypothetical protein
VLIDHLPRSTLEWLSLPVLADPFWERLPWLLKRLGGNTASKRKSGLPKRARVRGGLIFTMVWAGFYDRY